MIPSGYKAGKLYSVLPTNGDGDFTVTRNSVATRVNENGLIEEVAANVPRLDYSDGGCPSLLLEGTATNLITYSEDFSNSSWNKIDSATIDSNVAISPKGDLTADRLNFSTTLGSRIEFQSNSRPSGDYNFSFYAKTEAGTKSIGFRTGLPASSIITVAVNENWQRFNITQNNSGTNNANPQIRALDTLGGSILIYGAQFEQNSHATSYIKTIGATQTRVADTVTLDLTPFSLTSITETIGGVEQTPITVIPSTYTIPFGKINKIIMI